MEPLDPYYLAGVPC